MITHDELILIQDNTMACSDSDSGEDAGRDRRSSVCTVMVQYCENTIYIYIFEKCMIKTFIVRVDQDKA